MVSSSSSSKRKPNDGGGGKGPSHSTSSKKSKRTGSSSHNNNSNHITNSKGTSQPLKQRKHADVVTDGKRIWNQLRLKTNSPEQTRALVDELMPLVAGKAHELALQHDASRVVQAAIQFGSVNERRQILKELTAHKQQQSEGGVGNNNNNNSNSNSCLVELSKSQYAHFVVLKAFKYCHTDKECTPMIVAAFKGHMTKLAVHATASRVVEALFQTYSPRETAVLKQEFYGPHFALFAADTLLQLEKQQQLDGSPNQNQKKKQWPTLASNLALTPDKKDVTLEFVRNLVNKGMEKQLYGFTYFQELLLEYLEVVPPTEVRTVAGMAADHVIHLLSAKAGTKVAALLTAYGTVKDRKRIIKSLKGYTRSGLLHRDAYLAILRLVQLTDDTVSIQKNLFNELLSSGPPSSTTTTKADEEQDSPLLEIALSDTGSKLFLMLLIDDDNTEGRKKMLDPYEHSVLFANPVIVEDGQEVPTSKKDPAVRRKELIKHLRESLIQLSRQHADQLLRSIPGSAVLREVYAAFKPVSVVVEAILKVCHAALPRREVESSPPCIFEDVIGHRALKNLILVDAADDKAQDNCLAAQFLAGFENKLAEVAISNRGAFVVAALCKVPSLRKKVIKALKAAPIKNTSKKEGPTAGFEALLKEIS